MANLIETLRKSYILTHPSLPCLAPYYTINLAAGCPFQCRYCYAQSFRHHPGGDKVLFYKNSFELLKKQLPRMRLKPRMVYFSTGCEPFMPYEQILTSLHSIIKLLLENSINILISTKSQPPEEFLRLFAEHPGLVHVQVGITTVDDRVRQLLEPNALSVNRRLASMKKMVELGISTEARMDPLTPGFTDTEESFAAVGRAVAECGVRSAVASYLFLRKGNYDSMKEAIGPHKFSEMFNSLYHYRIDNYCGSRTIRIPPPEYRKQKYALLGELCLKNGIDLHLCSCKNPEITSSCCHPRPIIKEADPQLSLFECEEKEL